MAHFYYNFDDFLDNRTIGRALRDNQRNSFGPTKTSASSQDRSQISATTYSMSQILQGEPLMYPTGFVYDNFNQTLSSDLGGLLKTDATEIGGRKSLIPSDILTLPGYGDPLFSTTGASGDPAAVAAGGTGGVPAESLEQAIPLLRNNVNIEFANNCFARVESGEVDASILNAIWFISQHIFVVVWNMKRDSDTVSGSGVSQHFVGPGLKGRAADLGAFGPSRLNGGGGSVEQVIDHGRMVDQAFAVIDTMPAPMWPSEIVLGPYDYTPQAHSGINFSTNGDHQDHIHVGYSEYHNWMGTNQPLLPRSENSLRPSTGPDDGSSTNLQGPSPRQERKYRRFLRQVTALDARFESHTCPLNQASHGVYMTMLHRMYGEFDLAWNYYAADQNDWGYHYSPGQTVNGKRARPPTPCEKRN